MRALQHLRDNTLFSRRRAACVGASFLAIQVLTLEVLAIMHLGVHGAEARRVDLHVIRGMGVPQVAAARKVSGTNKPVDASVNEIKRAHLEIRSERIYSQP